MAAPPDHARAPELKRAALKQANEEFARLLEEAIRSGRERGPSSEPSAQPGTERPLPYVRSPAFDEPACLVAGVPKREYARAWRERQRETRRAIERRAQREQAALLEPKPRPRPPIGRFTIMDLADDTCRFPIGDGPYLFCGATPVEGKPYCERCVRGLYRSDDDIAATDE
jgi:hypothetical protein